MDNLIFVYEDVSLDEFDSLMNKFYRHELVGNIPTTKQWIGKRRKDYHYNFKIGEGEGAITIGFKHNASAPNRKEWDLRVEVNPSKHKDENRAFETLQKVLGHRRCIITGLDFAFDIPVGMEAIQVVSKNGREENRIKGTLYYGSGGVHGFLRVYDKRAERESKGHSVDGTNPLTRIEFCFRVDGMGREKVALISPQNVISDLYDIYRIGSLDANVTPEVRCLVLGVKNGWVQLKDFTRTNQQKVKNALAGTEKLALDSSLQEHWGSISKVILKFTYDYFESESTKQYSLS